MGHHMYRIKYPLSNEVFSAEPIHRPHRSRHSHALQKSCKEIQDHVIVSIKRSCRLWAVITIIIIIFLLLCVCSQTTYAATVSSCTIVVRCRRIYLQLPSRCSAASVVCSLLLITPSISAKVQRLSLFCHCLVQWRSDSGCHPVRYCYGYRIPLPARCSQEFALGRGWHS